MASSVSKLTVAYVEWETYWIINKGLYLKEEIMISFSIFRWYENTEGLTE